jgi:MFS family permease
MNERNEMAWWTVAGAFLSLIFCNGPVVQFTFGVFIKPIGADLGAGRGSLSLALTIGVCTTALCMPVAGRLVDRFGSRAVALPSILMLGFAMMTPALATEPWHFVAAYGLIGVAAAGQTPLPYARLVAARFSRRRGLALGVTMSGVGLGAALLPLYSSWLIESYGWRSAYVLLGLTIAIFPSIFVALLVKESRGPSISASVPEASGATVGQAIASNAFWIMAVAFFLSTFAGAGIVAHIVPLLTDGGVQATTAAGAISAAGVAMIIGRLACGALLDKFDARFVAAAFFLLQAAGGVLLTFVPTVSSAFVSTFLVGLGVGAEVDLISFMLVRYFGMRSYGTLYGLLFAVFMLAGGVGPLAMAVAFAWTGGYSAALIGFDVAFLGAALLMAALKAGSSHLDPQLAPDSYQAKRDTQITI